jgi:hypothetical protein
VNFSHEREDSLLQLLGWASDSASSWRALSNSALSSYGWMVKSVIVAPHFSLPIGDCDDNRESSNVSVTGNLPPVWCSSPGLIQQVLEFRDCPVFHRDCF